MSLIDILKSKLNRPYLDVVVDESDDDTQAHRDDWVQFVRDYMPWIKARSTPINIDETIMSSMRHNLRRYMLEKGYSSDLWWIILELNGFRNDMDFDKNIVIRDGEDNDDVYMRLLVPNDGDIALLYDKWQTSSQSSQGSTLVKRL